MTTSASTVDAALAVASALGKANDLERQLVALPKDDEYLRKLEELAARRDTLSRRIVTIRSAATVLRDLPRQIADETKWRDHLVEWRKTLLEELGAFDSKSRDPLMPGKRENVVQSIAFIDGQFNPDLGWTLHNLRLGDFMRAAGFVEGPRDEKTNAADGPMPWSGSLPQVEERLKGMQERLDDAQRRLDVALKEAK